MIKVSLSSKDKRRLMRYLSSTDRRVTAFFRGAATHAARLLAIDVNELISPNENPLAKEYKDGVRALRVKGAEIIPREEKGKIKMLTKVNEEHWAAVAVRAMVKRGDELGEDSKKVLIKIRPLGRKMKSSPKFIWPLVRYGPWTLDTLPYAPKPNEALTLYIKTSEHEVEKVYKKNKKERKKVVQMLNKSGIVVKEQFKTISGINAVEEIEYYALRKEYGMIAGAKPIWRPSIKKLKNKGPEYLLKTNSQLYRSLFDPSYRGYGNLGRFTEIEADKVKAFKSFQDRIS